MNFFDKYHLILSFYYDNYITTSILTLKFTKISLSFCFFRKWGESLTEEKINYLSNFINLITNLTYDNMNELEPYKNDKILPQNDFRALVYKVIDSKLFNKITFLQFEVQQHFPEIFSDHMYFCIGNDIKTCSILMTFIEAIFIQI